MQKLNLADLQKVVPVLNECHYKKSKLNRMNKASLYELLEKHNLNICNIEHITKLDMIDCLLEIDNQEFIKTINALRLENKGSWYQWCGEVNNYNVSLKGYGTWVQRLKVDDTIHSGNMEVSVKEFKEFLSVCVK